MLTLFEIGAALLVLSAAFSWFNHAYLKLPHTIGLLLMALLASFALMGLQVAFPALGLTQTVSDAIGQIDFNVTVMNGMLAFLLFAGALHVDMSFLKSEKWAIGSMATIGVLMSTFIVGTGFVVVFAIAVAVAVGSTGAVDAQHAASAGIEVVQATAGGHDAEHGGGVDAVSIAKLFFVEAGGGALLGAFTGWLACRMMGSIDEHAIEILISLGIVAGTYAVAQRLHLSGPIAVVITGLLIGNRGAEFSMSDHTRTYLFGFWEMVDEILNSVLFLLIGLELLVLGISPKFGLIMLACIPLVLLARFVAVSVPMRFLGMFKSFTKGAIPVLTWGGVRGGISVALALSLPPVEYKPVILAATYGVVVFSIIVQGLTVKRVVASRVDPGVL